LEALGEGVRTHVVRYPVAGAYDYATCQQLVRAHCPQMDHMYCWANRFQAP
jgi:hypothetical protein